MKSNKGKGLLGLIVVIAALAVFGWFGYTSMDDIKLGLDLAGGVSITYQTVETSPTAEEMSDTIYKLQQRVQNYSTEAEVYQEGSNRINIDIPGVSDANAILEELGFPDGKQVLLYRRGRYFWAPELELRTDAEELEELYTAFSAAPDRALSAVLEFLPRYQGDFLPNAAGVSWTSPSNKTSSSGVCFSFSLTSGTP